MSHTKLPCFFFLIRLSLMGLLCLFLAGCGDSLKLEKPAPLKNFYVLKPDGNDQENSAGPGRGVLSIKPLNVAPDFRAREFVYRLQDDQYASDYYNQLLTAPGSQLGQCFHDWLNNSGVFEYVINSNSELDPSFVLEISLRQLYGDFRPNSTPSAVMDMQIFLLQEKDYEFRVLFTKEFHKTIPITERTADALITGYNTGLTEILQTLKTELRPVVQKALLK